MSELSKLRELLSRATPGEWDCCDGPDGYQHRLYGEHSHVVCDVTASNDAALIVAMRNNIERLLAIAEAVEACPVVEVTEDIKPENRFKPVAELDWPSFQTSHAKILRCDENGRLVACPVGGREEGNG